MKGMSDKTKGTTEHGNSAELVCMARVVQISDLPQMPPPQIEVDFHAQHLLDLQRYASIVVRADRTTEQ